MNMTTFRRGARYLSHRLRKVHPYEIQACITNECNMKCAYCFCPNIECPEMTTEQWLDTIRELRRYGTMRIKWQGGEPTLREDLPVLTAEIKRQGMTSALATNGFVIAEKPDVLDNIDEIIVTLNSLDEKIHNDLRGEGSYRAVTTTMDLALSRGVKVINNMVVNKVNYAELEAVMEFCLEKGVLFHAQPVMFGMEHFDGAAKDLELSREQIIDMHTRMAGWKSQGRPLLFSASAYQDVLGWEDHHELYRMGDQTSSCFAGRCFVHIEPNGDVLPCYMQVGSFEPKNIIQHGLLPALEQAQHHFCQDCWVSYYNERKAVYGLKWEALKGVIARR